MNKIYVLYQYRYENTNLICISSSFNVIQNVIVNEIASGNFQYGCSKLLIDEQTVEQQIENFKKDCKTLTKNDINKKIRGGYFSTEKDGERLHYCNE